MAQETELKLLLQPKDWRALLAHPLLAAQAHSRQRLYNTYFDTPDLSLMRQRIAVRERRVGRRELLTVKTAGTSVGGLSQRGEWEGPSRPGVPDFSALVTDVTLATQLQELAPRLLPLFRTDFTRHRWLLSHAGAQIEVALDRGEIVTNGPTGRTPRHEAILELELELCQGPVAALWSLALALAGGGQASTQALWLLPSDRSKAERGLALYHGAPWQPRMSLSPALQPDMSPRDAFRTVAQEALAQWQTNLQGLLAPTSLAGPLPDPEFVHQARVALRRLRTAIKVFANHLPKAFVRHWSERWRTTASALGEVRNRDVLDESLLDWLGDRASRGQDVDALQPLADWSLQERVAANRQAIAQLLKPELARQQIAFAAALHGLSVDEATRHEARLDKWARGTLQQRLGPVLRKARKAHRLDVEALHALRIRCKKLRYAQQCLQTLLSKDQTNRLDVLVRAQDDLGMLNDLSTIGALMQDCPAPGQAAWQRHLARQRARILQRLPRLQRELHRLSKT